MWFSGDISAYSCLTLPGVTKRDICSVLASGLVDLYAYCFGFSLVARVERNVSVAFLNRAVFLVKFTLFVIQHCKVAIVLSITIKCKLYTLSYREM